MKLAAVTVYWVIVALWLAVLVTLVTSYLRNPKRFSAARTLLIIVAIDTLRNLVENGYFGTYFGAQYGFFSSTIADVLGDPRLLIVPKVINVIAACMVLGLMVLRWLPEDLAKHEDAEKKIQETSDALHHEEEERKRLFDSSVDLILITDRQGTIVRASPSSLANLGYSPEEMAGRNAIEFIHPDDLLNTRSEMRSARTGRHTRNFETRYIHKGGHVLTFAWSGVWSEPEQRHFFVGRDITEQKAAEEKLKYLAHFDELTALPNRVSLQQDLQKMLSAAESVDERRPPTSVVLIDLDGFKDVNDTLGHSLGDELLRQVASRLISAVARDATVYRLGGDEFVLAVPDCGDLLLAGQLAEKALKAISHPVEIAGERIFVGASAGIAIAPNDGRTVDEIIASADLALYDAKAAGGKTHRLFVPTLRAQAQARRALDGDLRRAFADREFEVYFQPQIRLRDRALVGAEALLRWHHPERGLVSPGGFIDALAKSPVSLEVGRWVLQKACQEAAGWQKFGPFRIGVNLFPAQFNETIILDDVARALDVSGLPPSMLEIEITENIALRQDEAILVPLRQLRDRGVSLAFDDFGTGYASLSYLRRYPLTRLKIDKSFVQKLDRVASKQDASIVRSIINMSHNLDLEVIAEGVETPGQAEFLRTEGCEEVQGYLYGKPMPATEFEQLFHAQLARIAERKAYSA